MPSKDEIIRNLDDWVAEKLFDDEFIASFCSDILLNHPTTSPLYTQEQMFQMFRAGVLCMTREEFDKKVFEALKRSYRGNSPGYIMQHMKVGEKQSFPYSKWGAVRTAASTIKKRFGCVYSVNKVTLYGQVGNIEVMRIK